MTILLTYDIDLSRKKLLFLSYLGGGNMIIVSSQKITVKIKKVRDTPNSLCYVHNV